MKLEKIEGLDIQYHDKSKRIINIQLDDVVIEKLTFNFKNFEILTHLNSSSFHTFTQIHHFLKLQNTRLYKLNLSFFFGHLEIISPINC